MESRDRESTAARARGEDEEERPESHHSQESQGDRDAKRRRRPWSPGPRDPGDDTETSGSEALTPLVPRTLAAGVRGTRTTVRVTRYA